MEIWSEIRRRVLTGKLSMRQACSEYGLKTAAELTLTFDGARLTWSAPGPKEKAQTFKAKIDAGKKPHRITLTTEGGDRSQTGIFKIEKGELFLAMGKPGETPTDFRGNVGSVMVLQKVVKDQQPKE